MSVSLVTGCMFSGKSTELGRRMRLHLVAKEPVLLIRHSADVREVLTHDGATAVACGDERSCDVQTVAKLADAEVAGYDVIGVEEGQFFEDLAEYCDKWAGEHRTVIVAALNGKYDRTPWDSVSKLIPLCEEIEKLTAVCVKCSNMRATFSRRTVRSDADVMIGDAAQYEAVCRDCWE